MAIEMCEKLDKIKEIPNSATEVSANQVLLYADAEDVSRNVKLVFQRMNSW
jgi:hypothetical protein